MSRKDFQIDQRVAIAMDALSTKQKGVYPQRFPWFFQDLRSSSIFELNCIW